MKNMKRILLSLASIASVGAVAFIATSAFFSDTETSVGNTFQAGAIDLQIASEYSSTNNGSGSVTLTNAQEALFNFADLKPEDEGEIVFSMTVNDNPAWACVQASLDATPENLVIEPESADTTSGVDEGELQNFLSFIFYADANNNGQYDGSPTDSVLVGPASVAGLSSSGWQTLNDSANDYLTYPAAGGPLVGGQTYDIYAQYCFGDWFEASPGDWQCEQDGATDYNVAQTDGISGTIGFYAVQSRNNEDFVCSSINKIWTGPTLSSQNQTNKDNNRPYINWTINGHLLEIEFVNPTNFSFPFEYRMDNEPGTTDAWSGDTIGGTGELAGDLFGDVYNVVDPGSNGTTTRTFNANDFDDELGVILHRGGENDWYLDWITFGVN